MPRDLTILNHLRTLWKEAAQNNCDIFCVQETHFHTHAQPKCSNPKFPHIFLASTDAKKRRVLTAIRDMVAFKLQKELSDPHGRYHILVCDINSTTYTVVNVYSSNEHQSCFFHRVLKKGYLLLCGEFDLPSDSKMDSTMLSSRPQHSLQPLLFKYDLYDVWRRLHATERDYSFLSTSHRVYTRLGLFLMDKWILTKIKASKINNITWLDRASVSLLVDDTSNVDPTFVWRTNPWVFQADPSKSELTHFHILITFW